MKTRLTSPTMPLVMFAVALTGCATNGSYVHLYGDPAPSPAAQRTIVIGTDTNYVNVEGGEVVRFIAGDKTFAWHFFVARTVGAFDLNEVAPPGILDHVVRAYVAPDPLYSMEP